MKNTLKLVLLPTEKESILCLNTIHNHLSYTNDAMAEIPTQKYMNLYAVSDEYIKDGDFIHDGNHKMVNKAGNIEHCNYFEHIKKVVITTDKSLSEVKYTEGGNVINGGRPCLLPTFTNDFINTYIERYNKGEIIEHIEVECEIKSNSGLSYNEYVYLQRINNNKFIPIKIDANISQDTYELGKEETFEDYELEISFKVNLDNTVDVSLIEDKLYTKEEMITYGKLAFEVGRNFQLTGENNLSEIENNL